jgi:hypothetical protein
VWYWNQAVHSFRICTQRQIRVHLNTGQRHGIDKQDLRARLSRHDIDIILDSDSDEYDIDLDETDEEEDDFDRATPKSTRRGDQAGWTD